MMKPFSLITFALLCTQWTIIQTSAFAGRVLCQSGLDAYQATLYPFQRQYCVSCHGDNGIAIGHSVSDPKKAYKVTRTFIDFVNIEQSPLMSMYEQQHWLKYGGSAIMVRPSQVASLIQNWWDQGERDCPESTKWVTPSQALPDPLPPRSSGQYATLNWDLSKIDAKFTGCAVSIDIQSFTPAQPSIPGSYRITNLRGGCVGLSLYVKGIWLPVSGESENYENTYAAVDQLIPPAKTLTDLRTISADFGFLMERNPGKDSLAVLFEDLEVKK